MTASVRRETALVAAIAGVCGAGIWIATHGSFFYADDWLNLGLARERGISWSYLTFGYFGHFAPAHRIFDWLWATKLRGAWSGYLGVMFALYALAVAAFYALLRVLRCRVWLAAAATVLCASSVVWVRIIQWPASGEHVVWAMSATAVSLAAAMAWFERRSNALLVLSAAAMAVGLLSYEKPVLVLMYVVLLRYFVLAPSLQPRALLAQARDDLPLLAALGAVALAYAVVVITGDYGNTAGHVALRDLAEFFARSWIRGTGSLVIGQGSPEYAADIPLALVIAAQVVLATLVVVSVRRRSRAWRAWAFLVVCWVVNVGLVGIGRVGAFGPGVALDPRYNAEMALLLPLSVALAFVPAGAPVAARAGRWRVPAAVLAVALLGVSSASAYRRVERSWGGAQSHAWVDRVHASAPAFRQRDGRLSVIDAAAPGSVVAINQPPYNLLSTILPIVLDHVDFDGSGTPAVVTRDGRLRAMRVRRLWGPLVRRTCGPAALRAAAVDNRGFEGPGIVRVAGVTTSRPAAVPALADYGAGLQALPKAIRVQPGEEASGAMAQMTGMRAIELRLPQGVCVTSLVTAQAS